MADPNPPVTTQQVVIDSASCSCGMGGCTVQASGQLIPPLPGMDINNVHNREFAWEIFKSGGPSTGHSGTGPVTEDSSGDIVWSLNLNGLSLNSGDTYSLKVSVHWIKSWNDVSSRDFTC